MTRKTLSLFVASALVLGIASGAFAFKPSAKNRILYPNLDTFEPNYYDLLKESGQRGVVVGKIKGERDPSLWIGANRFPMNSSSWTTHIFLRQHGIDTEPVYVMKEGGKEHLRLGHQDGPEFEYIWGGQLTFEHDQPWDNTRTDSFTTSEHDGRVVYVGYDKNPTTYSIVVENKVVDIWRHRPLVMPRFISVGTSRDDVSRRMISYQVISDDETSLVTVIGDQKELTPIVEVGLNKK